MTDAAIESEYFEWLYHIVCDTKYSGASYRKLMWMLHSVAFTYRNPMDANRADDGGDLRSRFGSETGYSTAAIASYLDQAPCSVLEMMVALAIRCEEHIMYDPEVGDRTAVWFWTMVVSLGLKGMDDEAFDEEHVGKVVRKFLRGKYRRDGGGGLFHVKGFEEDMRDLEIWYQMCAYLDSIE